MATGLGSFAFFIGVWVVAMLLAPGVMSLTWMSVTAILALAQTLLPPKAAVDVPLALTGLGVWIILTPSSVPGLTRAAWMTSGACTSGSTSRREG